MGRKRWQSLPVTDGARAVLATRREHIETVNIDGKFRVRMLATPIFRDAEMLGVLQTAQSLQLADSTVDRFRNLLQELKGSYDWVLVDSPPSASLADSSILAPLTDMVILVVRHNQTDRDLVTRNVRQLSSIENTELIGAVLNNVDIDRASNKDYYYAGYYYYTEGAPQEGKRTRRESRAKTGTD